MQNILSDTTKFVAITNDIYKLTLSLEEKLNRVLRPLKSILGDSVYNTIRASGSTIGTMYGLVKIHKPGNPIRPIVSSINAFNYNLSKFLVQFLSKFTVNDYTVKNTYSFIEEIKNLKFDGPIVMASFDVVSLFTNVPLVETCKIAVDKLEQTGEQLPFDRKSFVKLLNIAASQSVFMFNNILYKQIDGCSMGGPLSPSLANIFMCHNETIWLENCPTNFKPLYYRRYVDDCFVVFSSESHVKLFLDYLNCQHNNIKFTHEMEKSDCLQFLDATITKCNNNFTISVYRKPTFTGLGLHFFSFVPKLYKINSIKTLLNRAFVISTNYGLFHDEIVKLKDFFVKNSYPLHVIETVISDFLNTKFNPAPKSSTVPKLKKYIKLQFFGSNSYKIRNELKSILKQSFHHIDFQIVFTNPFTIGSYFKIKDRLPDDVRSCVVYNYQCSCCNARYIGSTTRSFKARRLEHLGKSIHTGKPLTKPEFSNIRLHSEECNHPINHSDFKILKSLPDAQSLLIAESIFIKNNKPSLNSNVRATELFTIH
jgi:hypothetical protein